MKYCGIVLVGILSVSLVNATSIVADIINRQQQAISAYETLEQGNADILLATPSEPTKLDEQLEAKLFLAKKKEDLMNEILRLETERLQNTQWLFVNSQFNEGLLTIILQDLFMCNYELQYEKPPIQILDNFQRVFWQIYNDCPLNEILATSQYTNKHEKIQQTTKPFPKYVGSFRTAQKVTTQYQEDILNTKTPLKTQLIANLRALQLIDSKQKTNEEIYKMSLHELTIWYEYASKSVELNKEQLIEKYVELSHKFNPNSLIQENDLMYISSDKLAKDMDIIDKKLQYFRILQLLKKGYIADGNVDDDKIRAIVNETPDYMLQTLINLMRNSKSVAQSLYHLYLENTIG